MEKSAPSDSDLLTKWLSQHQESAFHALVARYAGLVHAVAKRACGDESLAAEASQLTFILLARKAKSLTSRNSLAGWLHLTAVMQAKSLSRSHRRESRKLERLHESMETTTSTTNSWQEMQPILDDALASLSANDREAILLRFYRSLTAREIGETLGIATDAAQKRIDRATDRLRGKLAKRGCQAGGTLAATLLAGFTADSSAAVPAVSLLATKAIAAGVASQGIFSTFTALLTSITMKTTSTAVSLTALLAVGTWIAMQWQSIANLETGNAVLRNQLETPATKPLLPNQIVPVKTALDRKRIDWEEVARQLGADYNPSGYLNPNLRMHEAFRSMTRDELIAALDEIEAAELSANSRSVLVWRVISLLTEMDPEYVVKRSFTKAGAASHAFNEWVSREPGNALAWLDEQIAEGTISDRSSFETAAISSLLPLDENAAVARFTSLPESQRSGILRRFGFGEGWSKDEWTGENDPVTAYARLARLLPEDDHLEAITAVLGELGEVDLSRMIREVQFGENGLVGMREARRFVPYSALEDYFQRIDASPSEREACMVTVAKWGTFPTRINSIIEPADIDALRLWVSSQAPELRDRVTVLAIEKVRDQGEYNYGEWTEYALHCHQAGGGDELLTPLLQVSKAMENKNLARSLAARLSDMALREEYLKKLK